MTLTSCVSMDKSICLPIWDPCKKWSRWQLKNLLVIYTSSSTVLFNLSIGQVRTIKPVSTACHPTPCPCLSSPAYQHGSCQSSAQKKKQPELCMYSELSSHSPSQELVSSESSLCMWSSSCAFLCSCLPISNFQVGATCKKAEHHSSSTIDTTLH